MAELQPLGSIQCQNPEPDPACYVRPGASKSKEKGGARYPYVDSLFCNLPNSHGN